MPRPRAITDEQLREAARRAFLAEGPAVSAAAIGRELGVSGPAVLQRAGSKAALLRLALSSEEPPAWVEKLLAGPTSAARARRELIDLLLELASAVAEGLPILAVLRTSGLEPGAVAPLDDDAPPRLARRGVSAWLRGARVADPDVAAELLVGALEARAFVAWVHPQAPPVRRAEVRRLVKRLWPKDR